MVRARRSILPAGALLALFIGAVLVPALLSVSVGIVALALWRQAFDIIFGVLVLSFAATSLVGAVVGIAFVRRSSRLAELQSDFIAHVSHELRTPLAGIRLLVETLALGRVQDPGQQVEILERLAFEQKRLEELVERILQWRRLGSGPSRLPREPCDPAEMVAEAIAPLRDAAPEATVDVDVPAGLPPIWGVRRDLVMAIGNVVDNAVKFGAGHGPIEVCASEEGASINIEVRDRGPGIPTFEQKRIFEQFYRVPSQGRPGTGLGLAIVQRIVRDHRGQIRLLSAMGDGSRFVLQFPAVPLIPPPADLARRGEADGSS